MMNHREDPEEHSSLKVSCACRHKRNCSFPKEIKPTENEINQKNKLLCDGAATVLKIERLKLK